MIIRCNHKLVHFWCMSIEQAWLVGNECKNYWNRTNKIKGATRDHLPRLGSQCLVLNTRLLRTLQRNIVVQYVNVLCANRCRRNVVTDSANTAWKSPWKGKRKDIALLVTCTANVNLNVTVGEGYIYNSTRLCSDFKRFWFDEQVSCCRLGPET